MRDLIKRINLLGKPIFFFYYSNKFNYTKIYKPNNCNNKMFVHTTYVSIKRIEIVK